MEIEGVIVNYLHNQHKNHSFVQLKLWRNVTFLIPDFSFQFAWSLPCRPTFTAISIFSTAPRERILFIILLWTLVCFSSLTDKRENPRGEKQSLTNLPIRRNSPATPSRLMAISSPRTVMPSQKQTTTRAFGRRSRSFLSSLSKCFSPALL